MTRHRIAIGGIHIESSTFSPHRSGEADFTVVRGDELLARYDDLPSHVEWLPIVHARALPGGAVERDFYESVKNELLRGLRAALPLDGVFLDIHGAMSVVGMTDAEGDLAQPHLGGRPTGQPHRPCHLARIRVRDQAVDGANQG